MALAIDPRMTRTFERSSTSVETLLQTITAIICSGIVAGGLVVAAGRLSTPPRLVWSTEHLEFAFDRDAKQICFTGLTNAPEGLVPCYRSN
jgi:hypothetical protein